MSPKQLTDDNLNTKIEDIINETNRLVFQERECISYHYLSRKYSIQISDAQIILEEFRERQRNNANKLKVNFLLCGNDNDDDVNELKIEKFRIVEESDIDSVKELFKNVISQHIYSVSADVGDDFGGDGDCNARIPKNILSFVYDLTLNNKEDIESIQNLTYIRNPNVELRTIKRREIPVVINHKDSEGQSSKLKDLKAKDANDLKTKAVSNKGSHSNKKKNVKQSKVSSMFTKSAENEKIKETPKNEDEENDPFRSESEDEIRVEDNNDTNDKDQLMDEDDDGSEMEMEESNKNSTASKRRKIDDKKKIKKKRSDDEDDDDDEEIFPKKNKSKNKKRFKRIRIESDSDESMGLKSDDESPVGLSKSFKRVERPKTVRKQITESHVDDDGYTVTEIVTKEFPIEDNGVNDNENDTETKDNANEKPSVKSKHEDSNDTKSNVKGKDKAKEKGKDESKGKSVVPAKNKSDATSKGKAAKSQMKNQTSITAFFKPKVC